MLDSELGSYTIIFLDTYDRNSLTNDFNCGDRVLIGIHNNYVSELIAIPHVEQVFVSVKVNN